MRTKDLSGEQKRPTFTEAARKAQLIECAIETIATLGYAPAPLGTLLRNGQQAGDFREFDVRGR